jgi:outer membrane protein
MATVKAAEGRRQQISSALSPTLSLTAGYNKVEALQGGGTGGGVVPTSGGGAGFSGWQGTANVRQLLFDFNRTRDLVRQSDALLGAAGAGLTRVQADIVEQTKQAFYIYQQAVRMLDVQQANLESRRAQLALAKARLENGVGAPSDVVRAQTAVAEASGAVTLASDAAEQARITLSLRMGIDPRTPIRVEETGERDIPDADVGEVLNSAARSRPEVRAAMLNLEAARHGASAAKQGDMPIFNATFGLASRGPNFPPNSDFLSLGVTISWSPFDSGLTAGRVKEANGSIAAAEAALQAALQTVAAEVAQSYTRIRSAKAVLITAQSQLSNAEEGLRLAEGRYRGGVGTFLEILDAQAAVVAARTQVVNARQLLEAAKVALERAAGITEKR